MQEAIEYARGANMIRVESEKVLSVERWRAVNAKMKKALDLLKNKEEI